MKTSRLNSIPKIFISVSIVVLMFSFQSQNKLTEEQAIQLAEQFIIDNGYTTLPGDKSKMSYELLDQYENNKDSILQRRHNTLQPKAFCISENETEWHIGFLSTDIDLG